jgi:hypothetical protein
MYYLHRAPNPERYPFSKLLSPSRQGMMKLPPPYLGGDRGYGLMPITAITSPHCYRPLTGRRQLKPSVQRPTSTSSLLILLLRCYPSPAAICALGDPPNCSLFFVLLCICNFRVEMLLGAQISHPSTDVLKSLNTLSIIFLYYISPIS